MASTPLYRHPQPEDLITSLDRPQMKLPPVEADRTSDASCATFSPDDLDRRALALEKVDGGSQRIDEIDFLKGFLTLKMAGSHLAFFAVPGFALMGKYGAFSFGLFLFLFGVGHGISSRTKSWRPMASLAFLFLIGGLLTVAFQVQQQGHGWSSLHMQAAILGGLWDALTLTRTLPMTEFIFPYLALGVAVVAAQRWIFPLTASRAQGLIALSILLAVAGEYLRTHAPMTAGGILFAHGFPVLQMAPVFAAGIVGGWLLRRPGVVDSVRKLATWPVLVAGIAIAMVCQETFVRPDLPVAWRASGQWSYIAMSIVLGVLSIQGLMVLMPYLPRGLAEFFQRSGKRAMLCLHMQGYGLPLVGIAVLALPSVTAQVAVGAGFLLVLAYFVGRKTIPSPVIHCEPAYVSTGTSSQSLP